MQKSVLWGVLTSEYKEDPTGRSWIKGKGGVGNDRGKFERKNRYSKPIKNAQNRKRT